MIEQHECPNPKCNYKGEMPCSGKKGMRNTIYQCQCPECEKWFQPE